MDKRKINQDVYEKYVDASVALFMEYYCATLSEDIHQEIDKMKTENIEFPDALDARCRATIKKECATRKRKQCLKSCVKGLRYVASVAIVLLALASILFVSVEAIRVPIINYYISLGGEYLEIGVPSSTTPNQIKEINWKDPLDGLIPDDYNLFLRDENQLGVVIIIYSNQNDDYIHFSIDPLDAVTRIDTENAQKTCEFQCSGQNAVLVEKDGVITVAWGQESLGKSFSIRSSALTESEIIIIAESFIQKIS